MRLYGMDTFERWLGDQLSKQAQLSGDEPVPSPRYAAGHSHKKRNRVVLAASAVAGSKLALAATATVALAAAGIGAKTATTGNPNPLSWGSQVTQQVENCKQSLPTGEHGIGPCVSTFAKQHGDTTSDQHSQSQAGGDAQNGKPAHGNSSAAPGHNKSDTSGPAAPQPGNQGRGNGPPSPFPGNGDHGNGPPSPLP
jgi:hypothetical protein